MNIERFSNGGFVVHGITHLTKSGKVSAWYDNYGTMQDCEFIDSRDAARVIPDTWTNVIHGLHSIGGAYSSIGRLS